MGVVMRGIGRGGGYKGVFGEVWDGGGGIGEVWDGEGVALLEEMGWRVEGELGALRVSLLRIEGVLLRVGVGRGD